MSNKKLDTFILNGVEHLIDTIVLNGVAYDIDVGGERYNITWDLERIVPMPNRSSVVANAPLQVVLDPSKGYEIDESTVLVMMGDTDITSMAYSEGTIAIASVTGNVTITARAKKSVIDLLNVTWANHAVTCGQSTANYNAWSPHNLQYDDVNGVFVFLQSHTSRHISGTKYEWTLSIINPYDPNDVENIPIPSFSGLGMLFIENGTWTLMPRGQSVAYRSSNRGVTWETLQASIPTNLFGVYKCGSNYYAGNDTNVDRTYFKSSDLLNWSEVEFPTALEYSVLCETTFTEFDGKYWAFNRTNDAELGHPVILQSEDDGETWTLFSDQLLHGYRSTVSCYPFKNYIVIADVDRDNAVLYYSKFDGQTFTQLNMWTLPSGGNDFHNVNIASNYEDTVILEFMHAVPHYNPSQIYRESYACDNVMIVGGTGELPSLEFSYLDSDSAFLAYANDNLTHGTNGGTYTWSSSNNGARVNFGQSLTEFTDEIDLPKNMIIMNTSNRPATALMDGEAVKYPWTNARNTMEASIHINYLSARGTLDAFIDIDGVRYSYTFSKENALPVLLRENSLIPITLRGWSATEYDITGHEWQGDLGFRKIIPVPFNSSTAYATWGSFSESRKIAFVTYIKAQLN